MVVQFGPVGLVGSPGRFPQDRGFNHSVFRFELDSVFLYACNTLHAN